MKPISKKPLKPASARKPITKVLTPKPTAAKLKAGTKISAPGHPIDGGKIVAVATGKAPEIGAKEFNDIRNIADKTADRILAKRTKAAPKAAQAPEPTPAPVAPAAPPEAAQAQPAAPRATLRSLAQAVVDTAGPEGTLAHGLAIAALRDFLAGKPKAERGPAQPTETQAELIDICTRPQGATARELANAVGWPSIAARTTLTKMADRFGYTLTEKPKAAGRGITFYMERNA
jgi:hypothetical protein